MMARIIVSSCTLLQEDAPETYQAPASSLTLLGLSDDLLKKVFGKLDLRSKFEASQVLSSLRKPLTCLLKPSTETRASYLAVPFSCLVASVLNSCRSLTPSSARPFPASASSLKELP